MKSDFVWVLRSIHSDPAAPVYLMPNLLALASLGSAKRFPSQKAAYSFLSENPGYAGLRPQMVQRRAVRWAK